MSMPICRWRCLPVLLLVVSLLTSKVVTAQGSETPDEHISRLVKEALGAQPVHQSGSASEQAFDQTFRSQYSSLIRANRDYLAALKGIDNATVEQLGTPHSLADPPSAEEGLRQLHLRYDLEVRHELRVQQNYAAMRRTFESADWAAPILPQVLRILREMIIAPSLERQHCIAAERAWIDSMDELYRYAAAQSAQLHLAEGVITASDPAVQRNLNERIVTEETLRKKLLKLKQEYVQMQRKVFDKVTITPKSVGLQ